jgi:hypothetical protein
MPARLTPTGANQSIRRRAADTPRCATLTGGASADIHRIPRRPDESLQNDCALIFLQIGFCV